MTSRRSSSAFLTIAAAATLAFDGPSRVHGQALAFDAVTVRVNTSGDTRLSISTRGRTYTATNAPLRSIILQAYNLSFEAFRLQGGPSWIRTDRFDIVATIPDNATSRQVPSMLQALLAERFKLTVHTETREVPIYELVVARNDGRPGAGLRPTVFDCDATPAAAAAPPKVAADARPNCGMDIGLAGIPIRAAGQDLGGLTAGLAQFVDRRVVDKTGLSGRFDFELKFATDTRGAAVDTQSDAPSIFTALQEQLGLKLDSARGPVEIVVIDSIERLSAQ
jgi:uncharacterized protein (TIGR03435 family)